VRGRGARITRRDGGTHLHAGDTIEEGGILRERRELVAGGGQLGETGAGFGR
jgi:hypothetical protein